MDALPTGPLLTNQGEPLSIEDQTEHLRALLAQLDAETLATLDCAVLLQGSLAAGVGHAFSDIDVMIIDGGQTRHAERHDRVFTNMQRRVEIRCLSVADLRALASEIAHWVANGSSVIDEDLLHLYQQLSECLVLRTQPFLDDVLRMFPRSHAQRLIYDLNLDKARAALRRANFMQQNARDAEARAYAVTAAERSAKCFVVRAGRTYMRRKQTVLQLSQVPGGTAIASKLGQLMHRRGANSAHVVNEAYDLFRSCTLEHERVWKRDLGITRMPDVEAFKIGATLHLVQAKTDVFVLDADASSVWERIHDADCECDVLGPALMELFDAGLVSVHFDGGRDHWGRRNVVTTPQGSHVMVGERGARMPLHCRMHVYKLPICAKHLAAAGCEIVWAHAALQAFVEDVEGASRVQHWSIAQYALREMARRMARVVLCGLGKMPLPPAEELFPGLMRLSDLVPKDVSARILRLSDWDVRGAADTKEALRFAVALLYDLPAGLLCEDFVQSLASDLPRHSFTCPNLTDWWSFGAAVSADIVFPQVLRRLATLGSEC